MEITKKLILNNHYFSQYLIQKVFYITNIEIVISLNKKYFFLTDDYFCHFIISDNKFESFDDKPAIYIHSEHFQAWLSNNKLHRGQDKPSVISHNNEYYFYNDKKINKGQFNLFENVKDF